ncbi:MAG: DUF4352 domain-containing protein [Firmicutes bacterium]|nr:DUF4352 domain-containing protein [Bacillota bacterium]
MKKVLLWGGIAVIVLVVIAAIASGGGNDKKGSDTNSKQAVSSSSSEKSPTTTDAKKEVKVGETLTVGEVKWTAGSPERTDTIKSDNEFIKSAKANGIFVIVPLTAELVGKESGTIDSSQLNIVDSKGRKFKPTDNSDVLMLMSDSSIFLKQVDPNVPVSGKAVFDIATDATGLKLEVEDLRAFSNEKGYIDLGL